MRRAGCNPGQGQSHQAAPQRDVCRGCSQASKGAPPTRCWSLFLTLCTSTDRPTGSAAEEVKALADASLCVGCGKAGHRCSQCHDRKGQASTPLLDQLASACTLVAKPAVLHDDASPQPAADLMSEADCYQHSVLPGHIWRSLSKLTKPFDLIIGCNATGTAAASMTPDQFLTTLHEGHALIDASRCTPFAAKQLILHAQACRKRKAFSAVYLLPASKDAVWKNLVSDAPHVAKLRLTFKLHVHAHYHRIFVPELNSWPCRLAGQGAQALNDGGSQLNLLSKSWAAEQGLAVPASTIVITLGDGTTTTASGPLTIRLTYGSFKGDITVHGFPWEEDKPGTHHHVVWNLHGAGILITRLNGSCYVLAMNHLCLRTGLGSQARSSSKQPSPGRIQRNLGKTVQHSCSLRLLNGCTFVPLCQPDDLVQLPKMLPEPIMHARQQSGRLLAGGLALPSSISFLQVRMTG